MEGSNTGSARIHKREVGWCLCAVLFFATVPDNGRNLEERDMKTVGQILEKRNAVFCPNYRYVQRGQSVLEICRQMTEHDVGAVCVFDGARLVGVLSERDVVRRVVLKGLDPAKVRVEQVMTTDVLVSHPEEDYRSALAKMQQARVRHLPVVQGDLLVGMLSIRDLREQEESDRDFQLQALQDYVYTVPPNAG